MIQLFLLPGVFIHEFSHLLVGLILNARPVNFSIIPSKKNNSAGHVSFRNITFYNAFPVAIAPTIIGPGLLYFFSEYYLSSFVIEYGLIIEVIFFYFLATTVYCCLPSRQDISVIFKNPLSIVFYSALVYFALKEFLVI